MVISNKIQRMYSSSRNQTGLISLTILLLTSLLVTPLLVMSFFSWSDLVLTRKTILKRKASHLAEYAFWHWLALSEQVKDGYVPDGDDLLAVRRQWSSKILVESMSGGTYRASAVFMRDADDLDGNPDTRVVLYDRSFGFDQAPFRTGGYPVIDVFTRGSVGVHHVDLNVATTVTPYLQPEGATLNVCGAVTICGPAEIDGRFKNGGTLAVHAGGEIQTDGKVSLINGTPLSASPPDLAVLQSPYDVLGLDQESLYLEKKAYQGRRDQSWTGTVVFTKDYSGPVNGRGTFIVHNPRYDPGRYMASFRQSLGVDTEEYDPSYSHLDPANQPAVLEPQGNCEVQGVVIADDFKPGFGHLEVRGLVFILNPIQVELGMSEGIRLHYCRDSLRKWVHGDCDTIIEWCSAK